MSSITRRKRRFEFASCGIAASHKLDRRHHHHPPQQLLEGFLVEPEYALETIDTNVGLDIRRLQHRTQDGVGGQHCLIIEPRITVE